MDTYENMYKTICRVCLLQNNNDNMVSLMDNSSDDGLSSYGKAIAILTSVSIQKDDKLPSIMCQSCVFLLKQAISFKLKCESTDQQLKRLVNSDLKKDESDAHIKEIVCEYVLYNHYFGEENNCKESSKVRKKVSVTKSSGFCHKNGQKNSKDTLAIADENDVTINDYDSIMCNEDSNHSTDNNIQESNEEIDNIFEMMQIIVDSKSNKKRPTTKRKMRNGKKPSGYGRNYDEAEFKFRKQQRSLRRYAQKIKSQNIPCKICNKVLSNIGSYKCHMMRHNVATCRYMCDQCGKAYPALTSLQCHQIRSHGIGPYLQCDDCPYKATRKIELIEHIRLHTGERPFTCETCGKSFRRKSIWRNHMVCHFEKRFQCSYCPKKFFRQSQMLEHQNNIHVRKFMFLCSVCNVMFGSSKIVRRHMINTHGVPREKQGKIVKVMNTENEFPEK